MTLGELIEKLGGKLAQGDPEWNVDSVNSAQNASLFDLAFADAPAATTAALAGNAGVVVLKPGVVASYPHLQIDCGNRPAAPLVRARCKAAGETACRLPVSTPPPSSRPTRSSGPVSRLPPAPSSRLACTSAKARASRPAPTSVTASASASTATSTRALSFTPALRLAIASSFTPVPFSEQTDSAMFATPSRALTRSFRSRALLSSKMTWKIGANSTVDRGALKETRIRRGTKIDNLVHVGHNCDIGEDVILVALTGISGSSSVGNGAVIAGQVGLGDHVHIGPGVILGGQAGVFSGSTVSNDGHKPGTVFFGTPARPLREVLREQATARAAGKAAAQNTGIGRESRSRAGRDFWTHEEERNRNHRNCVGHRGCAADRDGENTFSRARHAATGRRAHRGHPGSSSPRCAGHGSG